MGLPNVFLAGGQSDVPHYFHFCRPRQLRSNRAVGAPHSGDANAIDGQSRQKARHLAWTSNYTGNDGARRLRVLRAGVLQFQPRPKAGDRDGVLG